MLIPKEILREGTYWYDDENGQPRQFTATPAYIRYLHDQGKAMRSAGLSIPLPFEHQPDHKPLTKAEKAAQNLKNNAGWVDDFMLENGRLYGMCDVDDKTYPDLMAKLPKTIKYTSPWLTTFTDGDGKKWEGVIGHLALTSRPRIKRQEPFPNIAAALSLANLLPPVQSKDAPPSGLYLSRAGLLRPTKKGSFLPDRPIAFSILTGVKLASDFPPEKEEKPEEKPPEGGKEGEKPPEGEEKGKGGKESMRKMSLMHVLVDLLDALFGIQLPEEGNEKTLLEDLVKACTDHLKGANGDGMEDEEEEVDPLDPNKKKTPATPAPKPPAQAPVVQETQPMYMSLEEVQKITDPGQKRLAEALLSLQGSLETEKKKSEALAQNTLIAAGVRRQARLDTLCKRLAKATSDKLLAQAKSIQLSLGDDGKVVDPLDATLELLEETSRNLPALLQQQAGQLVVEQEQPKDFDAQVSAERRKDILKTILKNSGMDRGTKAG